MAERRRAFFNVADIFSEVATVLARHEDQDIDWITFVGSGETTLFSRLGSLIRMVKSLSDLPVAVITNGSLLHLPRVRKELMVADAVLPTLDAGTDRLYRTINRPRRDLGFDQHVRGLIEFSQTYRGELWVEVMLLRGVNDSTVALREIAAVLRHVRPNEIHLSTPTRPPAEPWVRPPDRDGLDRAVSILGTVAKVLEPVDVEGVPYVDGELVEAVVSIVSRHPLQDVELERFLARWVQSRVDDTLADLVDSGRVKTVERFGRRFWCAEGMEFPDLGPMNTPSPDRCNPHPVVESHA
jgi:wyosine [tRNA(Phe)-imidazoG37] synthetase (radical SAM superfamily)